jgi:mannose-6-phosphate isomerase-like protein (cupin superfamily)
LKTKKTEVIVRDLNGTQAFSDVCGKIRALSSVEDFKEASLAHATMKGPTEPHFHKILTEFYYVLEGKGNIIIGRKVFAAKRGTLVIIPQHLVHYTIPQSRIKVLAFAVPAWSEKDQYIANERNVSPAVYSPFQEKAELINEILRRENLNFEEEMTREEREALDIERQTFGFNRMSMEELRKTLTME